jgi:hypothetical protein
LIIDYPGQERDESCISFTGVALYHFIHASAAIILDIEEIPVPNLLKEWGSEIAEWNRMHDVRLWKDNLQDYSLRLQSDGYEAWRMSPQLAFMALSLQRRWQKMPNKSFNRKPASGFFAGFVSINRFPASVKLSEGRFG